MRISDWSSDVCSSDLLKVAKELKVPMLTGGSTGAIATDANTPGDPWFFRFFADSTGQGNDTANAIIKKFHAIPIAIARHSVVEEKSGSVRLHSGGRVVIKKKKLTIL